MKNNEIICPKCQHSFGTIGAPGAFDLLADEKLTAKVMVDHPEIEWDTYFRKWSRLQTNMYNPRPALMLNASVMQIIARLETEKGRIYRLFGNLFIQILKSMRICPSCDVLLGARFRFAAIITLYGLILISMTFDSFVKIPAEWQSFEIFVTTFILLLLVFDNLFVKKYQILDCSDEGLLKFKSEYRSYGLLVGFGLLGVMAVSVLVAVLVK